MTSLFQAAPEPKTELGRHRILATTAGARVSPFSLGAMSIGKAWESFMGSMSKEDSFKLLDHFYNSGGNFIDTANNYQNEESELWIGEWMAERKNRDSCFVATKYTTQYREYEMGKGAAIANYSGNHRKSMHVSVRDSLKKLQTDYIDLLYLHWWDWSTSIEEVMDSLHVLVQQGKVLYLGISDSPAWIVSAANTYAQRTGKTPFSVYQGRWNVILRDLERDVIPMARHFGMAICPWDVIGGGRFKTKAQIEQRKKEEGGQALRSMAAGSEQSENEEKISAALEKVGKEVNASLSAVAIAYVMQKTTNVFPIIGGRKVEHLDDNINALKIHLSDAQIQELESVTSFDVGFPTTFIGEDPRYTANPAPLLVSSVPMAWPRASKPIGHE